MKASARSVGVSVIAAGIVLVAARSSYALGFRNPDQGARATGQGEAFVAQADDASAIYYNPAGLTQVTGAQITSGGYLNFSSIRFEAAGGGSAEPRNNPTFLPHFYAATDLGSEQWRVGIGANVPFGNDIDWGKDLQYLVTKSELAVYSVQPTVAYRFNEHLSLGAGFNIYVADTTLERNLSPSFGGGHFKYRGSGNSLGATLGTLWTINEHNAIGLVYRSPFTVGFGGSASLRGNFFGLDSHSPAQVALRFPQSLAIGYALRPTHKLKLELDVEWTNWDTLNVVGLHSPNPLFDVKTNPAQATTPFNWKDSFFYELGGQYDFAKNWTARAGYIYSENTVPSSSFSPVQPDSNRHVFSVGLGYVGPRMNIDAVYQYSLSTDRTITGAGNPLAGEWSSSAHALMFTSTFHY